MISLEALTGRHPYEHAKSFMSLTHAICTAPSPEAPAGTTADVADFIAVSLRKEAGGKLGRPPVRVLVTSAWLKAHTTQPSETALAYLSDIGLGG